MGQRSPEAERQESHHLYPLHEPGDGSNKPVGLELEQVDFEPHLERGIPPEAVDALLKHIEEGK